MRVVGTMVGGVAFDAQRARAHRCRERCACRRGPSPRRPIPLTVIGGFLGAGKTTLVNAVLAQRDGRRLAVLVNDFGALSIDATLISTRSAQTIALANGCVCCTLVDGLTQALIDVLALDPPPDHVLVEASGVSDPRASRRSHARIRAFAEDATLVRRRGRPDRDARARSLRRRHGAAAARQAARSILLNKLDLVERRTGAMRRALAARSRARVHECSRHGGRQCPMRLVLGPASCATGVGHATATAGAVAKDASSCGESRRRPRHRVHDTHVPLRRTDGRRAHFAPALDVLPDAVLRAKGLVQFDTAPQIRQLVQAVGRRRTIALRRRKGSPLRVACSCSSLRRARARDSRSERP